MALLCLKASPPTAPPIFEPLLQPIGLARVLVDQRFAIAREVPELSNRHWWHKASPHEPVLQQYVAASLNNLAELYHVQGQYTAAKPLHKRALAIREKALGPAHPQVATSLNNLAALYRAQGQYTGAEPLYKRALAIIEKALGPAHPDVARVLAPRPGARPGRGVCLTERRSIQLLRPDHTCVGFAEPTNPNMIIRNPLQCTSCSARVITRTAPGLFPPQEHRFPCPGCGVEIRFTLKQSKRKKVGFSFGRPINAKWVKSEKGAVKTLNFDPDRVAPKDTTNVFSPFLAEAPRMPFAAHRAYAREEGLRRAWRESQWPWIQRLIVHFDSGNLALFDKEAKLKPDSEHVVSWATRLRLLYSLFERAFDNFTLNRRPAGARVHQRIALAQSTSTVLFDELVKLYATSSRVAKIWQELMQIRTSFLTNYPSIRPVLRAQIYWSRPPKDLADFEVSEKRFDQLKQLYVDCFETLCRLTVIAVGLEAIIHHNSLNIETAKDSMTLWDYEAMHNGNKHTILGKYPIHDLFVPVIDHKLRNGLGHNSAIYIPATDEVVYYKQDDDVLLETRIAYTEFVLKVLQIFSVMELGAIYFHSLHIKARETYMK